MQQQELLQCIRATLIADPATRQAGEAHLVAAAQQPGFGSALVTTTLAAHLEADIRQLAAVLLKGHIKEHWTPEASKFKEPLIEDAEKAAIRASLPAGLADANSKIRTAVGMAVAAIAKWDVPEEWPTLVPDLLRAISEHNNSTLVYGAVRCLSLFADELDDDQVLGAVPSLFPELLAILRRGSEYPADVRRQALSILHSMLGMLATMTAVHNAAIKSVLSVTLGAWFEQFGRILAEPLAGSGSEWGVKLEVLRLLTLLAGRFSRLSGPHLPAIMAHSWQLFVGALPLYEAAVVREEHEMEGAQVDEEGAELGFEALVVQLFEFLLTLAGSSRFRPLITPCLDQMVYLALGYMQMTAAQAEAWEADANQHIADEEDDIFTVRVSGDMLLGELLGAFGAPAAAALSAALQRRLAEASAAKAAGAQDWWKLREAALLAAGNVEELLEAGGGALGGLDVSALLDAVVREDLAPADGSCSPFLRGRALWLASKCAPAASAAQAFCFVRAAAAGISAGSPPPVRVGACRAITALCKKLEPAMLASIMPTIYNGLGGLLGDATEEGLHLALETLTAVINTDPGAAAQWEAQVSPAVLRIWIANVADPVLAGDTAEMLEALAAIPECLAGLQTRLLPSLRDIVMGQSPEQSTILVEGALDLLAALLRPSPAAVAQQIHAAMSGPVMALMMTTDDAGILQSCTEYLRCLVRIGGEDLLRWNNADPAATLGSLLAALGRLLQPALGDSAALYVGPTLLLLLQKMPSAVQPVIPQMLEAVVAKLGSAQSTLLISSLLLIIARLVHLHLPELVQCLAALPGTDGEQGSALAAVMRCWTQHQIEFSGVFEIKLSATALALLLASGRPELAGIMVRGRRLDTGGGPRTRSRAKVQAEQWESVALPLKLASLLADALAEAQAQANAPASDDEDSDEWVDDGEEDDVDRPSMGLGLEDILAAAAEDESESPDDNDFKDDPIMSSNLALELAAQLQAFASRDPAAFQHCASYLSAAQQLAVQQALH